MKITKYTFNHGSIAYWAIRDCYINPFDDDEGFIELMSWHGRGCPSKYDINMLTRRLSLNY